MIICYVAILKAERTHRVRSLAEKMAFFRFPHPKTSKLFTFKKCRNFYLLRGAIFGVVLIGGAQLAPLFCNHSASAEGRDSHQQAKPKAKSANRVQKIRHFQKYVNSTESSRNSISPPENLPTEPSPLSLQPPPDTLRPLVTIHTRGPAKAENALTEYFQFSHKIPISFLPIPPSPCSFLLCQQASITAVMARRAIVNVL